MAADFIHSLHGRRQTLDDLMGDDASIFRSVMQGPAQRQPADNSTRGFTRPEDRDPNSDASIFSDIMSGANKPADIPRTVRYRGQWD